MLRNVRGAFLGRELIPGDDLGIWALPGSAETPRNPGGLTDVILHEYGHAIQGFR